MSIGGIVVRVGMWESRSDFQGRWEAWESWVWISTPSTARHFHMLFFMAVPTGVAGVYSAVDGNDTGTCQAIPAAPDRKTPRNNARRADAARLVHTRKSR